MTIIFKMIIFMKQHSKRSSINSVYITVLISLGVYNSYEEGDILFNKTRPQTAEILMLKVDKTYTILY